MGKQQFISKSWEKIFFFILFVLSFYLMFHTFGYDSNKHEMLMNSRVWSDFGAHIPLIRSFSLGYNIPPEYPIFPGEKIRYHFLLYMIAGILEKLGLRIDYALNIPSALGFFFLTVMIYKMGKLLFNKSSVGFLAVIFFLFNGSLSFLKFFEKHPLGSTTLRDIVTNNQFSTFGPWDGNLVTAFVHLNIYTNQRHIALGFAIVLVILYILFKTSFLHKNLSSSNNKPDSLSFHNFILSFQRRASTVSSAEPLESIPIKQRLKNFKDRLIPWILPLSGTGMTQKKASILLGVSIGLLASSLLFLNQAALIIGVIFLGYMFIFRATSRIPLLIAALVSVPFILYFFQIAAPSGTPLFEPGYLSKKPFAWPTFIEFWIHNMGLHTILIPLGIVMGPKKIRFFFIPLVILFIIPNMYRFSPDMINNHKFFNFFMIIGSMYSAHAITTLWQWKPTNIAKKIFHTGMRIIIVLIFPFLIFSGVLDFMPVVNDYTIVLSDIPTNKDATFILQNTSPDAIILNSTWFYHPTSIAGRKVYNGYSFFTWSAGYDTYGREALVKEIYRSDDRISICKILKNENISYVELNRNPEEFLKPISYLWLTATPMYDNTETGVRIYDVSRFCSEFIITQ